MKLRYRKIDRDGLILASLWGIAVAVISPTAPVMRAVLSAGSIYLVLSLSAMVFAELGAYEPEMIDYE